MWKFAMHCHRRFRQDARYDLQYVTRGFLPRLNDSDNDSELLERICTAYIRSVQQEQLGQEAYKPTEAWLRVRQQSLKPFIQALLARDIAILGNMLRNFKVSGAGVGGAAGLAASEHCYLRAENSKEFAVQAY
jgi:hypothetical protein